MFFFESSEVNRLLSVCFLAYFFISHFVLLLERAPRALLGVMMTFSIVPSPKVSDTVVEPYNCAPPESGNAS